MNLQVRLSENFYFSKPHTIFMNALNFRRYNCENLYIPFIRRKIYGFTE